MASFSTLIAGKATDGSIANWVNRAVPATNILTKAQAFIYRKLRVREMMVRDDLAAAIGVSQVSVPSDFLDPVSLTPYGWGEPLDYVNESIFVQNMDEDGVVTEGTPNSFTIIGSLIVFDSKLDETFGGKLIYFELPTALGTGNENNFLTTRYPDLLEHACLSYAYEHMKDEQRSLDYRKKAEAEAAEISRDDELFRRGQR
jgi:hypothetical protein